MKKIYQLMMVMFLVMVMAGCSAQSEEADKLTVAVSIVPQASFIEAIAGDLVEVVTLIPSGASPTNYQPTPSQMAKFGQAQVYFTIGVGAEAANILPNIVSQNDDLQIIDLASLVDEVYDARYFEEGDEDEEHEDEEHEGEEHEDEEHEDDEHEHAGRDPHIWMSPKRVIVMAQVMNTTLKELDPENAHIYDANTESFINELETLDQELLTLYEGIKLTKFIVMHPSIGYMADDYGLEMIAIEEEGKEASVSHLQSVIDYARAEDIHVVFYQQEFDSTQAETIAEEINGSVQVYEPLSGDYFASMRALANAFKAAGDQ